MLTSSPVVLDDVLDVCHPAPAVVTESPSVLETRPPLTVVLDLNRSGRIEAALPDEPDCGHETQSTRLRCGTKRHGGMRSSRAEAACSASAPAESGAPLGGRS